MTPPLPPPAHDAPLPPVRPGVDGTRWITGMPYAAIPGVRPLELDLVLPPPSDRPPPVVLFLHGGGWRLGSRHSAGPAFAPGAPFEAIAARGVAVASADYRLSGEAVWPAALHDAKAAVRWLRARAPELGIDPDRIGAWGESAGAHLAALLGLTGSDLDGDVGVSAGSTRVACIVTWYAPTDLPAIAPTLGVDPAAADSREALLLGAPLTDVPARALEASPVHHVAPGAPPFLLLHGAADTLVPCAQSETLHQALRAAGAEAELHRYPGADHLWRGAPDAATDALARTADFLATHLT